MTAGMNIYRATQRLSPHPMKHPPLTAALALLSMSLASAQTLDLTGAWRFELDRTNAGVAEHWAARKLAGHVGLPGSLEANGIGDPVTVDTKWTGSIFDPTYFTAPEYAPYRQRGNIKVPFWLQPETHYTGAAWFQREVELTPAFEGKRVVLTLERPHWKTTVWFDGREIGSNDSLSTAH